MKENESERSLPPSTH